jgi:Zn-dependent protease with chaperone function
MASPGLLRCVILLYIPFLAAVCLGTLFVAVLLVAVGLLYGYFWMPPVGALLLLLLVHVLYVFIRCVTQKRQRDRMEMRLPRKQLREVYELVEEVGRRWKLPMPDEVRLGAMTVAHVYENDKGKRILVFGAMALATFSLETLAGIIAHELAHFEGGDTALLSMARRQAAVVGAMEWEFQSQFGQFNPLFWVIHLYHLLWGMIDAAVSRQQEYLADARAVERIGPDLVAAALVYMEVTESMEWMQLPLVVWVCLENNVPLGRIFKNQARRARTITKKEWREACRKALRKSTRLFDSHPALRDRLQAMGVSPDEALRLELDHEHPPACELIADWPEVERELADRFIEPLRELHDLKLILEYQGWDRTFGA